MKNRIQANGKDAAIVAATPEEKPQLLRDAIVTRSLTADDPLKKFSSCIVELGDIGDRMQPEIPSGSRAVITRRKDPEPASGELVLGLLKTGHVLFGVFHTPVHQPKWGLWQIRTINPKYPPAHYLPHHFHWFHRVDVVQIMGADGYISRFKSLEYSISDDSLDDPSIRL